MRVVLINAPYLDVYGSMNVGKNYSFSLGLGYIAAVLKKAHHTVNIMEPEIFNRTKSDIENYLIEKKPDIIGITSATPNFDGVLFIAKFIKGKFPALPIVLGGVHASSVPREILANFNEFDIIVIGEGEETMRELCGTDLKKDLVNIKGIAFRNGNKLVFTPPRPFIQDVDKLPFPARELVDLTKYRPQVHVDKGKKSATLISSRGCPYHCTFCDSHATLGNKFRPHNSEYVISEIEYLIKNYGIEHFIFVDDTFTIHKGRVIKICNMIIDRKLKIIWHCFSRVDTVDRELLVLMKRAGCFSILFGVESGDEEILKNIKKGATIQQARYALKIANELGFKTICGFIFGNPGETRNTIIKTTKFALELNPTLTSFNTLIPFPGTEIGRKYYSSIICNPRYWKQMKPRSTTPLAKIAGLSTRDLQNLTYKAYLKFYGRPTQIIRMVKHIKSFTEFLAYIRGGIGVVRKIFDWIRGKSNDYEKENTFN